MKNESVKTITDGRRLSVQKVISGQELMDFAVENGGNVPFGVHMNNIREDMVKSIAGVIARLMPVKSIQSPDKDEVVLTGNIYIFTPEQLSEYNKNIIEEYKRKQDE